MDEFTKLYLAQRPVLSKLVRRILRYHPPEEIEDVLQDVWLKGSLAYAKGDVRHFRAWIGRTAINVAINRIRRFRREPQPERIKQDNLPRQLIDRAPLPDEIVLRREVREAVAKNAAQAPKMIEAVRLMYLEGYSCREVAEILGVVEGTVKSNAHKGIARIFESLTAPKAA